MADATPVRIQRQRKRGWKKPANTVCVTRGTLWGNPFVVRPDVEPGTKINYVGYTAVPTVADAIACYREYLLQIPDLIDKAKRNLRGKNLACFCALDQPCHADVLLQIVNEFPVTDSSVTQSGSASHESNREGASA